MQSDSVSFGAAVRAMAGEARRMGLVVPGFRSPPTVPGADRTIHHRDGQAVVAVRVRGRPFADVIADVIEGILVVNAVDHGRDLGVRRRLLAAAETTVVPAA